MFIVKYLLNIVFDSNLKIGLYNPGSLGTNHDNIVASFSKHCMDLVAINETWVNSSEDNRAPTIPNYRLRHIPRPSFIANRGGGVGFYVKKGIVARKWAHPVTPLHASVEQMWLTTSVKGKKLVVGTAYRPPRLNVDMFFDALTDSVNASPCCDNLILLGDFNINDNYKLKKFQTFLECLSLNQVVTMPTHFTDTTESLIDVVCTNLPVKNIIHDAVGRSIGHQLIVCEFKIKRDKIPPSFLIHRPLNNVLIDLFNSDLKKIHWNSIASLEDVNDMVEQFSSSVLILFDLHAPVKTTIIKDRTYPWITFTIKEMMSLRDEALLVYRKTKSESKKIYYKDLKSEVNRALFFEKVAYFNQNINKNINDPKSLWKNLKSTIVPTKLSALPSHFDSPDAINTNFLNIPGIHYIDMSQLTYYEYHTYSEAVFNINLVNCQQIIKIIKSFKSNAEGPDKINLKMLLMTLPETLEVITSIINTSISTSTFPKAWKSATVRPLPKISEPVVMKDLRPISILPCASKILERAVCSQLTEFLEANALLPEVQSGFRKGRSTATALLDVTDNILGAQDKGLVTVLVLLDFSRAFDAINNTLLLSKLSYYGFSASAVKWFNSYLSDRYQHVKLTNLDGTFSISNEVLIERGVPQGSILGPILFIIYTSDLAHCIKHCKYHIYADDVQIYISFRPEDALAAILSLNEDLARISDWSYRNSLVLNPLKTKYMVIGTKHKLDKLDLPIDISLMGEPIERVYEARNLGLNLDAGLRFEKHVADSIRTCFYKLKVLYNIRPYLSEDLRIQLVESLVLSRLNYLDTVTGPRLLSRTQRLIQRVQNACARFCFKIPYKAHVTPFLNHKSVLKMKARQKLHLSCLLFGVIKHESPGYLYERLTWFSKTRSLRRCSTQLSTQYHRTTAFRGSFRYAASKCWNNIPPPIRDLQSIHGFKYKLKKFLLDHQKQCEDLKNELSFL